MALRRLAPCLLALALGACGHAAPAPSTARVAAPAARSEPVRAVILDGTGALRVRVRADGPIVATSADGRGGWFVSGRFTHVDGVAQAGLAHLGAHGAVIRLSRVSPLVAAWERSHFGAGLAASARYVYLDHIRGDDDRMWLAVLDAGTGMVREPPRAIPDNGPAIAADASHLFVGNPLPVTSCVSEYDALGRRRLARLPIRMFGEISCVNDLQPVGRYLYVAGSMDLGHGHGAAVARFAIPTGRLDQGWLARPRPCRQCTGLAYAVAAGPGRVYVSPGLEALSARTGMPAPGWHPPAFNRSAAPLGLAFAGRRLFVLAFRGLPRRDHGLLALDPRTGVARPSWHPPSGLQPGPLTASAGRVLVVLSRPPAAGP